MLIGYMRVSKADGSQVVDLQRDALLAAGVDIVRLYEDHASGHIDDRPGLIVPSGRTITSSEYATQLTKPPESLSGFRCSSLMHFYAGPPMHFLSGVDTNSAVSKIIRNSGSSTG